jgi:nucleoside phosphorylase
MSQIGIVTALPEEWLAITTALNAHEVGSVKNDPNRYATATLPSTRGSSLEAVISFLPRTGTDSAATVTTNLLRSFPRVDDLIFSGIACGCPRPSDPDKHVRLGDIVVSDARGLVQTDHQTLHDNDRNLRSAMPIPSRRLLNCVRLLEADRLQRRYVWDAVLDDIVAANSLFRRPSPKTDVLLDGDGVRIKNPKDTDRRAGYPKVVHGTIGSSNTLFRNSLERDKLAREHGLTAFEMEGAGTAEAVWHFGKNYIIIRGICDYGDGRTKNDKWHNYAAAVAAAYTTAVLNRLRDDWIAV